MCLCVFVLLPDRLSVCLSIGLSVCVSVQVFHRQHNGLFWGHMPVCLQICLAVCLTVCLSVVLLACLSVCLSMHISHQLVITDLSELVDIFLLNDSLSTCLSLCACLSHTDDASLCQCLSSCLSVYSILLHFVHYTHSLECIIISQLFSLGVFLHLYVGM